MEEHDASGFHASSPPRWYRLSPSGEPPRKRCSHTTTYVEELQAVFVVGGGLAAGPAAAACLALDLIKL